ncbi:helix-turn-helix domain-containing protein [Streptomyces phaeochromogenes]|uniref:helix-turn-helix domain-containing protein n=1 Tax=Streptomyces phaeochromogenes TaxID=1923 RepID=UPI0036CE5861
MGIGIVINDEFNPEMLKNFRQSHKLSQAEFARRVGLPRPSVTNYEAGKRVPTRKNVARIALAFDVSMRQFYTHFVKTDDDESLASDTATAIPAVPATPPTGGVPGHGGRGAPGGTL